MQRSLEPELLKSDGGAQPVKRWSDWRSNKAPSIESSSEESSIPSMDPSLARFHDHTDPEEDLEAWSREVAEEEVASPSKFDLVEYIVVLTVGLLAVAGQYVGGGPTRFFPRTSCTSIPFLS